MIDEFELSKFYGHSCLTNIKNWKKHNLKPADYSYYFAMFRNG